MLPPILEWPMSLPTRSPGFTYKQQRLCAEHLDVRALAKRFGTPLYVYSQCLIAERYEAFTAAFRDCPHRVCYSVKANPNLSILRLLWQRGAGFDVVSGGELERVLTISKKAARHVVFSGVGKTAPEIDAALSADILLFNVESASELDLLAERAAKLRKKARISLRVNPDVRAETHPYISTGLREHKFGVPMGDAAALYRKASRENSLGIAGVSVHIGSQITDVAPFAATANRIARLVTALRTEGHKIQYVDMGGGLGIDYAAECTEDFAARAADYATAVLGALGALDVELLLEPGRAIIGTAGALLTRVVHVKQNGAKTFVVVDAAMNDLIRPSLYNAFHHIIPAHATATPVLECDVVGPICETGDFFARDRQLPRCQAGDLLAILDAGAYGMSIASNYNSRPRGAEVLVNGKRARLIRKRETMQDLLRPEL
jgi:diaminopimelate decarboxylase